jgi:hypothetical protein
MYASTLLRALPFSRLCFILQVDVDALLADMDRYFTKIGPSKVRQLVSSGDRPIKMVKTMLYELCKEKGLVVLHSAKRLSNGHNSDNKPLLLLYIEVNFKSFAEVNMMDSAEVNAAIDAPVDVGTLGDAAPGFARAEDGRAMDDKLEPSAMQQSCTDQPAKADRPSPSSMEVDSRSAAQASTEALPLQSSNAVNVAAASRAALLQIALEEPVRKQVSLFAVVECLL